MTQENLNKTLAAETTAEATPTAEALKQQMEDLKARVALAQRQKEQDIEKKITDRESLISETNKNDELLTQASETLTYFASMQELGQLTDEKDIRQLEELRTLVASLGQKREELTQTIAALSGTPDILDKLEDLAHKENAERAIKEATDQAHKELDPKIDQLAEEINRLATEVGSTSQNKIRSEDEVSNARNRIKLEIQSAINKLKDTSELSYGLHEDWGKSDSAEEFKENLLKRRKSLGMFGGKDKAAIDYLLQQEQLFTAWSSAAARLEAAEAKARAEDQRQKALKERYEAILAEGWNTQDKIDAVTGRSSSHSQFVWDLQQKMRGHMDRLAGVGELREGKESWHTAMNSGTFEKVGKNRVLYSFQHTPESVHHDPRKKRAGNG